MTSPSWSERAHTTTTSAIEPLPIQRLVPSRIHVVAVAAGARLQRDRVRAVLRLGQCERADRVQPRHSRQPALLLRLRAEQGDRLHRQPRLDAQERAEAAVAAVQFHVDQAAGERAHPRTSVALDVLPVEPEVREPAHERPWQLGALPVIVDLREDLGVDEAPGGDEALPLLLGEFVAEPEVVRCEGGRALRLAGWSLGHGRQCISGMGERSSPTMRDWRRRRAASRTPRIIGNA